MGYDGLLGADEAGEVRGRLCSAAKLEGAKQINTWRVVSNEKEINCPSYC